jgi:hypothetical protein
MQFKFLVAVHQYREALAGQVLGNCRKARKEENEAKRQVSPLKYFRNSLGLMLRNSSFNTILP